ncbi:hypothetical protein BDV95DRAFT_670028 [Massariosphaeria phaeospora]|uniref:DUF726-domain-containing protein n=1 Tax=Massariosphaeria phaeospora TaxID=100035 RepID=A0A7C8M5D4_9PLEO|nr:hypothetical protein BDV95DRAFT_670028 [Massariosphaeria phaeospora]
MLYKVANVITGSGSEASKPDEGASLTSVLETPALRVELALLVLLCTDAMRSDLLATFDPKKTHETTSSTAPPPPSPKPLSPAQDLLSFDEPQDESAMAAERAYKARQREVESTPMQGLRRSGLTFFDKWRAGVMHRICDVLCVRGEMVRQAKTKRKQVLEETERQKQGNSLLIDFGGDPFGSYAQTSSRKTLGRYEVIETKLLHFEEEKRVLILHCLLLLLLSLEHYPAHSRVLLLHMTSSMGLGADLLAEHEKSVAQGLLATAASQMDAEESAKKQASNDAATRRWKVGLAAVGGAVLIGVTGGLAAPLLAAGIGTVMGGLGLGVVSTYLGALAGSSVLVGSLFGAYGAKMTGNIMQKYAKEVQDFEFIPVRDPNRPSIQREEEWAEELDARDSTKREQHRLRVSIGISGWLTSPSDVNKPWEVISASSTEPFALRFELDAMLRMGNSLNDVLFSYAWDSVTHTIISRTLLGALYAGLWPLGLVKAASVLDNPFSVALARADKAGKVLAHALIDGVQGKRPVTLMGYSIGARVIYSCLVELAEQNAFGLIESVVLMGAPVPSDSRTWRQIRSVVAARVVNVYSTEDYILGFLYRSTKLQMGVAGLQEVQDIFGIENADMSKLVNGHDKYRFLVGTILVKLGFGDVEFNKVAEQERALELAESKKQQVREHVKKHNKDSQKPDPASHGAAEMIVVRDQQRNELVDVSDPVRERTASAPAQRPTVQQHASSEQQTPRRPMVLQQRSGQQPSIRRHATTPNGPPPTLQDPSSPPAPDMDPLSGNIPTSTRTSPPPARPSTFPVASLQHPHQIPSNIVPTPAAPPQRTNFAAPSPTPDNEQNHKIAMQDIDNQKYAPSLGAMLRSTSQSAASASEPSTTVSAENASVAAADSDLHSDSDDVEAETEDEDEDETSSEFGELSSVEPTPLDDNDFGLM